MERGPGWGGHGFIARDFAPECFLQGTYLEVFRRLISAVGHSPCFKAVGLGAYAGLHSKPVDGAGADLVTHEQEFAGGSAILLTCQQNFGNSGTTGTAVFGSEAFATTHLGTSAEGNSVIGSWLR